VPTSCTVAPTITSFTPTTAATGTTVTIKGKYFTGATAVSFGGKAATSFSILTDSTLTAVVGADTSGSVSITTSGGTGSLAGFTFVAAPTISSFTPTTGSVGTLVTITGTNLSNQTSLSIGGVSAIPISNTGNTIVAMVMPGAITGSVSLTTASGMATGIGNFTVATTKYPSVQQGSKLVGTGGVGNDYQGQSVAVSADGNTAVVGGYADNNAIGAVWIYTRSGSVWTQQGTKLIGTGAIGNAELGQSVAISADGNTIIAGGPYDNSNQGAAWVFTRTAGVWTQQGNKLVGTGNVGSANQGFSISLSADGNTALIGGYTDSSGKGAAWVFNRSNGIWTQQGSKLVGAGSVGATISE
jgi:hypothetical protein